MTDKTLPTLSASGAVAGTDLLLSRQSGTEDTKTTVTQLMTFVNSNVTAPAGTLTGATLAANVLNTSITSTGTLTGGATGAGFTIALGTSTITGDLPFSNIAQLGANRVACNPTAGTADISSVPLNASSLMGRGSTGNLSGITLGGGLSMSGTVLSGGDVVGPASSTDNAIARFDLATGKLLQNSVVLVGDTGNISGVGTLAAGVTTITATSSTALAVGATGATNPALLVNSASGDTGFSITSGAGLTVAAIGSGSDVSLTMNSKGNGAMQLSSSGGTMTFSSDNSHIFQNFGSNILTLNGDRTSFAPRTSSTASNPRLGYTGAANTTLTASTDFTQVYFNMGQTNQHATGAITTQRDFRITPMTHSAVASSTITNAYAFYVDSAPIAGTNVTITNSYAGYFGGKLAFDTTITGGGTTGNQTINKPSGTVNFAAAASSLTVTNNLVTASSLVFAVVRTNDTTAYIKNVVPSAGSFVITLGAAATAETSVGFWVING